MTTLPSTVIPFRLDFAVVNTQVNTQLVVQDPSSVYITELDIIDISENIFKTIFFNVNQFYVNPLADSDLMLNEYISFSQNLRTVGGKHFCLLDVILANYCTDAGVPQSYFTPCSLINLNKQINAIKTLYNVYQNKTGLCSLNWDEIVDAVKCEYDYPNFKSGEVILTFTVVFIPTPSNTIVFKPTIIKFNYRTIVTF